LFEGLISEDRIRFTKIYDDVSIALGGISRPIIYEARNGNGIYLGETNTGHIFELRKPEKGIYVED
jgi:hypothetical protein